MKRTPFHERVAARCLPQNWRRWAGYIAVGSLLGRVLGDTSYGQLAIFNEVVSLVLAQYVEPVNLDVFV